MTKHGFLALGATLGAVLSLASPAAACRTSDQLRPFLFQHRPADATAPIIAEVEVAEVRRGATPRQPWNITARVIRMVDGPRHLRRIRINTPRFTSCSILPRVGDRGFLAGPSGSVSGDMLTINDYVAAPSQLERERASQGRGRPRGPQTQTGRQR